MGDFAEAEPPTPPFGHIFTRPSGAEGAQLRRKRDGARPRGAQANLKRALTAIKIAYRPPGINHNNSRSLRADASTPTDEIC
jgi:hypothetical protein